MTEPVYIARCPEHGYGERRKCFLPGCRAIEQAAREIADAVIEAEQARARVWVAQLAGAHAALRAALAAQDEAGRSEAPEISQ